MTRLTCYANQGGAPRIYFEDPNGDIFELIAFDATGKSQLTGPNGLATGPGGAKAPSALPESPLTCFGFHGTDTRLYYLDQNSDVCELSWQNGWVWNRLTGTNGIAKNASGKSAPSASLGTDLTCFGRQGVASRVYYWSTVRTSQGNVNQCMELAWENGWTWNVLPGQTVDPSPLTCFGFKSVDTRLYNLSSLQLVGNPNLLEVSWQNEWVLNQLIRPDGNGIDKNSSGQPAPLPAAPTALTCFGFHGTDTRLYYLNQNSDVCELSWQSGWTWNQLTGMHGIAKIQGGATAPSARSQSALTCYTPDGVSSRVYYFGGNNEVFELAWQSGWVCNPIAAQANARAAQPGSPLTCLGENGAGRVYYVDGSNGIHQLFFAARWQDMVIG